MSTAANLESEWENFEKMLAGGDDSAATTEVPSVGVVPPVQCESGGAAGVVAPVPVVTSVPETNSSSTSPTQQSATASAPYNPYAYLSYLSADTSDGKIITLYPICFKS